MADKTITLGSDGTQKGLKDLGSSVYGDKVAVYDGNLSAAIAAALAAGSDLPVTLDSEAVVLGAGTAAIGKLAANSGVDIGDVDVTSLPTQSYGATVSLTRPADTTAYTAGDVIGIGTGAGGATAGPAALTFTAGPTAGGEVIITSAALRVDASAVPSGMGNFRLHLYNVTPPSALVDNAAWDLPSGDRASYLGHVDIGTPVDLGSTLYVQADGINKQITLASANLYGYLQTIGAFTPASAVVKAVTLHTLKV